MEMKNQAAVALGRLGGLRGGPARAAKISPEERSRTARLAALSRWYPGTKITTELADQCAERTSRIKEAETIAREYGVDPNIVEHVLRLEKMKPEARLVRGLKLGRIRS